MGIIHKPKTKYNEGPDIDLVKKYIDYDRDTGVFTWKVNRRYTARKGSVAGLKNDSGYILLTIESKRYRAHRIAWLLVHGEWPKNQIDHINGVRDDNRIENLRHVTNAQNAANASLMPCNTSGFKGVTYDKDRSKWHSQIKKDAKKYFLGRYDCKIEAAKAYDKKAIELFGEYAKTNKSMGLY
tara:strand:+ start:7436 stop:7984 length:549 start_codon:yes stop_codon:yes gene_type:complete